MTPRRRRLLLIVLLVLVGVPVLAAVGVGGYLRSGGLEREIERGWTSYGMPGRLQIGSLRLIGVDEAEAENIEIREDGQPPLAVVRKARLRIDLVDRRLLSLRIDGVHGGLDRARYRFLLAIIAAEQLHVATRAPSPVRVEVTNGRLDLPGGVTITDAAVQVDALGARVSVEAAASLAGHPLRLAVATDRASAEAPIVTSVEVREASISPRSLLDVVEGIGLVSEVPDVFNPWLPALADFSGTQLQIDVVSDTFRGSALARWAGGDGSCTIDADARRVVLHRMVVHDAKFGQADGELTADRSGNSVAFDATRWVAGPGLPLPSGLPMADMAKLLPELQVRWPTADHRTSIGLVGPGKARLEVVIGGPTAARLTASELPLVLGQGLLPPNIVIMGGHIVQASAVLTDGRPDFSARLSQARMLADGWSLGPLDGEVAAVIVPGGTVQVTADLLSGEQAIARVTYSGNASTAKIDLKSEAVERLLARVHWGPTQLPDLSGSLVATALVAFAGGAVQVDLSNLDLGDVALRLGNHDFIRGLTAKLQGRTRVAGGVVELSLDGHLRSGEIRIPGEWLPLAARTPRFTLDASARVAQGQLTELVLTRAMVRAADAAGAAVAGGFSAQLDGRITGERLAGSVKGVVDHADLAWLTSLVVPGQVQVGGEGAAVFQAAIEGGEVRVINGSFLPLGADLDIDHGKLKVGGITGGVNFTIGAEGRR